MKKLLLASTFVLLTSGCTSVPNIPDGFNKKTIETEHFSFYVLEKDDLQKGKTIRIYIEGDGNPNPQEATALEMAKQDNHPNVVYMARPCQYVDNEICSNKDLYTSARFHRELVDEMKELTIFLMKKHKTPLVEFVGYDGGATMALLLATKVPTSKITTIAGILDTNTQKNLHEETLNPADYKDLIARIPQVHFVGGKDEITTKRQAERFVGRMKNPRSAKVKVFPNMKHTGWKNIKFDFYSTSE